jgi:uncharacterized membrane protein YhaH (DUF805 family)
MQGLRRLGAFSGRASRREFATVFIAALGLSLVHFAVILGWPGIVRQPVLNLASWGISALLTWTQLAVGVRRLHDLGKTGWLLVLCIVPIVGVILLIWLFGRAGTPGQNPFGLPPNNAEALTAQGGLLPIRL